MKTEFILKASEMFDVHPRDLVGDPRFGFLIPARFAVYKALKLRGWSYAAIGRLMNRDHSTVIHGVTRADYMMERDSCYAAKVQELSDYKPVVVNYVEPEPEPEPKPDGEDWLEDLIR